MVRIIFFALLLIGCGTTETEYSVQSEASDNKLETAVRENDDRFVNESQSIAASPIEVWEVVTSAAHAKELGAEFDKGSFIESDWKLGSPVHFKYEPNKTVSTGTITQLRESEFIQVDYDFQGVAYTEQWSIQPSETGSRIAIYAGPYTAQLEAQKVVWNNYLLKVKEIAER
ncbi:MAG: hypothetical protein HKN32_01220 [Flavobacteriales bacterium]|nr:hypothetical protein [Flavobacteriales bacterium]